MPRDRRLASALGGGVLRHHVGREAGSDLLVRVDDQLVDELGVLSLKRLVEVRPHRAVRASGRVRVATAAALSQEDLPPGGGIGLPEPAAAGSPPSSSLPVPSWSLPVPSWFLPGQSRSRRRRLPPAPPSRRPRPRRAWRRKNTRVAAMNQPRPRPGNCGQRRGTTSAEQRRREDDERTRNESEPHGVPGREAE